MNDCEGGAASKIKALCVEIGDAFKIELDNTTDKNRKQESRTLSIDNLVVNM